MRSFFILLSIMVIGAMGFTSGNDNEKFVILIDAGHGGKDPGASIDEVLEKEIVLNIARRLGDQYFEHVEVIFSRNDDAFVSLEDRVNLINTQKPDLVLSLHIGMAESTEVAGARLSTSRASEFHKASAAYADQLKAALESQTLFKKVKVDNQNFFVIRKSETACVHVDLGFLSNETERAYLTSRAGQGEIVAALSYFMHSIQL